MAWGFPPDLRLIEYIWDELGRIVNVDRQIDNHPNQSYAL